MAPTVMIVEDDASTRRLYRFLLGNSGYTVVEAEDGEFALERFAVQPCDVVITDMNMPRMDGMELVRRLRATYPHVYIIMVTAYGSPDIEKQAHRAGVNEYLSKPFDFEVLEHCVQSFFAQRDAASSDG